MSQPAQVVAAGMPRALEVLIKGKVRDVRKHQKRFYTHIVVPSQDEYSSPSHFEVDSESSCGNEGEVVSVRCRLSGHSNFGEWTDKKTGELKEARFFRVRLTVIE